MLVYGLFVVGGGGECRPSSSSQKHPSSDIQPNVLISTHSASTDDPPPPRPIHIPPQAHAISNSGTQEEIRLEFDRLVVDFIVDSCRYNNGDAVEESWKPWKSWNDGVQRISWRVSVW